MEVLATYFFDIEYRLEKKMSHVDYLFRISQTNIEYPWDKKNTKYILNILYNDKKVYESERYKNLIEGFIQVPCGKIDPEETSYQMVYRKIKVEIGFHMASVYFTTDKGFNCNLYITDIGKRVS